MAQLTQNFLRKLIYSEAEYKYNISFDCLSYLIILGAGQLVIENFDMEDQNQDFSRLIAFLIWEIDFFFQYLEYDFVNHTDSDLDGRKNENFENSMFQNCDIFLYSTKETGLLFGI